MIHFNANKVKDDIVVWIRKMFEENGKGCNAVIGISGGKDSSVTAALCVAALGKDRVIGVLMPNGKQEDKTVAVELCNHLGINYIEINVKNAFDSILEQIDEIYISKVDSYIPISISDQTTINLPPRLRMATLYAVSQSVGGRVMNTCNLSEDYVGYATRYGDSAGDFAPLANLTSDEVIAVGAACGLPDSFIYKTPTDGLCGKTDEDNLGFTYKVLNKYIRTGICEDSKIKERIVAMHKKNRFKLQPMPAFPYNAGNGRNKLR